MDNEEERKQDVSENDVSKNDNNSENDVKSTSENQSKETISEKKPKKKLYQVNIFINGVTPGLYELNNLPSIFSAWLKNKDTNSGVRIIEEVKK